MGTRVVSTRPFDNQRPGTAGLRKKVAVFRQPGYLENLLQSIFDTAGDFSGKTIVAGGDGRFYNRTAIQTLASMAAANGVQRLVVGRGGLLSTPAASHLIRHRQAFGGFLLTASHNPGGPEGDFGVKFNTASGGQASESLTEAIYASSLKIDAYRVAEIGDIDLDKIGEHDTGSLVVEVIDPVSDYAALMEGIFDFDLVRDLLRGDFRMCFDAMHAVTGPYAIELFEKRLGADPGTVINGRPLEDFGGGHPDPNPVDAAPLVAMMGRDDAPDFAAASDGDGDRNMILGRGLVVSPGDSLAILAAHARRVPGYRKGLAGVARSMPTSRAVDRVAESLGLRYYETPTGWRFFCNLLEAGLIDLCGEESFGTSSSHAREKDGLWAVLFWLNLLAAERKPVGDLVRQHWAKFGRDAYCRHDYFIEDAGKARGVMDHLEANADSLGGTSWDGHRIAQADSFEYRDPVDGSRSAGQGIRVFLDDGSRIVYRLSGTGTSGATLRVYLERFLPDASDHDADAISLTSGLATVSRKIARVAEFTGLEAPTGIV